MFPLDTPSPRSHVFGKFVVPRGVKSKKELKCENCKNKKRLEHEHFCNS